MVYKENTSKKIMKTNKKELRNRRFKCVYTSGKEFVGHKIFVENDYDDPEAVFIADWSGDFPNECDDGELRIKYKLPIRITPYDGERASRTVLVSRIYANCKWTEEEEGDEGVVSLDYDTYQFLKEYCKMDLLIKHGVM
jgi:hypothetical protein